MEYQILQDRVLDEMQLNAALRDRKVYLNEEVDRESIFKVVYLLDRIVALDNKAGKKPIECEPIEILLDSYGGYINHGLSLISKIETLKDIGYKIITTVQSVAMSMGFMILITGSERRAYRHARIMCHQPSSGTWGELMTMQRDIKETEELWDRLKQIIIKYTDITNDTLEDYKEKCKDWYMWAEEAIDMNVIDQII